MTLPANFQKHIDDFFAAVKPVEAAYQYPTFNFVAIRHEDKFAIAQAAVLLNISPLAEMAKPFESTNVLGGQYPLSELNLDLKGMIDALHSGIITTPAGKIHFLKPEQQEHPSPFYMPFHEYGIENRIRLNILRISSKSPMQHVSPIQLDWEVKAAPTPFENLQELMSSYRLGQLRLDQASVEIIAYNVAAVDLASRIEGDKAWPTIRLARLLDPKKFRLGYRIQEKNGVTKRASLTGDQLTWVDEESLQRATAEVTIPPTAILHCVASYDGIAQQYGFLLDPKTVQNPRRAVFDDIDTGFEILKDIIVSASGKYASRDLEAAVSWILWMLGFSVAHFGETKGMSDGVDIVAVTPTGNSAVIECTIAQLKSDKLSLLHDRAESARRALIASSNSHLRVLPIFVTSKSKADLPAVDIERAERLGILVYTREDLLEILDRTRFVANPEQMFAEAESTAAFALGKYTAEVFDPGAGSPAF